MVFVINSPPTDHFCLLRICFPSFVVLFVCVGIETDVYWRGWTWALLLRHRFDLFMNIKSFYFFVKLRSEKCSMVH